MSELQSQKLTRIYTQESDCMDPNTLGQNIEISTENDGVSSGDFFYIKTERWAIDNIEELIDLLQDFKKVYDKIKIEEK